MSVVVATLYKFVPLEGLETWRSRLLDQCTQLGLRGTLLLATEGINGTVAGDRTAIDQLLEFLRKDPRFATLQVRESYAETMPFKRMKVKVKPEIVTFGVEGIQPAAHTGQHVSPQDWNAVISDPEVAVLDTRNGFEVAVGTFKGALDPHTDRFRDFPDQVPEVLDPNRHRKVAMFCTGGIRCEKASAYLLDQGFETVYQLEGGILNYLEQIPPEDSLWRGECFVFDERVAVTHGLEPGTYELCQACGMPLSEAEQRSPRYQPGIHCPHCLNVPKSDDSDETETNE